MFMECRIPSIPFESRLFLQGDSADLGQQEDQEKWGDDTDVFPSSENGGRGQVEAGPHHDLPQVVRVLDHAPQAMLDKLSLQTNHKQVIIKINRSRTNKQTINRSLQKYIHVYTVYRTRAYKMYVLFTKYQFFSVLDESLTKRFST